MIIYAKTLLHSRDSLDPFRDMLLAPVSLHSSSPCIKLRLYLGPSGSPPLSSFLPRVIFLLASACRAFSPSINTVIPAGRRRQPVGLVLWPLLPAFIPSLQPGLSCPGLGQERHIYLSIPHGSSQRPLSLGPQL